MGTHPIFESDFDCLTERYHRNTHNFKRTKMSAPFESDEDFLKALRNSNKKIDIAKELKVVDLTSGGKVQPYVKGLQVENELNKHGDSLANHVKHNPKASKMNTFK